MSCKKEQSLGSVGATCPPILLTPRPAAPEPAADTRSIHRTDTLDKPAGSAQLPYGLACHSPVASTVIGSDQARLQAEGAGLVTIRCMPPFRSSIAVSWASVTPTHGP